MIPFADIEFVARRMCEVMGVDPDKRIETNAWDGMTTAERVNNPYGHSNHPQRMATWQVMIPHAERALAAEHSIAYLHEIRSKERRKDGWRNFP